MQFIKSWTTPVEGFIQLLRIKRDETTPKQEVYSSGSYGSFALPGRTTYEVTLAFGSGESVDFLDQEFQIVVSCDTREQMYDPPYQVGAWYFFTQTPRRGDQFNLPQLRSASMFEVLTIIVEQDMKDKNS